MENTLSIREVLNEFETVVVGAVTEHAWSRQANSVVSFEHSCGRRGLTVASVAEDELKWLVAEFRVFVNCVVYLWLQKCVLCRLLDINLFLAQCVELFYRSRLVLLVDKAAKS